MEERAKLKPNLTPISQVAIPEKLFFDMVDLLKTPRSLVPAEGKCVLGLDKRNDVLDRLLKLRRDIVLP